MPGPDYPWSTYIPGAQWCPRPGNAAIRAVALWAQLLDTPEQIAELRLTPDAAYHYVITREGGVIQLVPERGMTRRLTSPRKGAPRDRFLIHICLSGHPQQPAWPPDQVTAVARLLSVIVSVRGAMPVRDGANLSRAGAQAHELTAWPWLDMVRQIIRLDTPIEHIYQAMLGADYPDLHATMAAAE